MDSATFQKWLAEHGCRFETDREKRGTGHAIVMAHREGRRAEVPLGRTFHFPSQQVPDPTR